MYRYLLSRCGSESVADDLLQAVFMEVVRHPDTFDGRADVLPWLVGIARHQLGRHFRRRDRSERWSWGRGVHAIEPVSQRGELRSAQIGADIRTAMTSLPALQQAVLVFRFLDGLSVREVADHVGRSEAATESLLRRARVHFEQAYRGATDAD